MRQNFFKTESKSTSFLGLDTRKCNACWKCINICSKNVIGRINLPWHKHVKFVNRSECIGCMKCVNICTASAIFKLS
ncbi:ferredoxin family protein [Saccharicrinis sp. FJH62]|uniref:4Fe-4S dicluster domain-containing protein n=1 Tax=Saccharicrinis sp. FJH62 TaxID=3344657 RepID=UPI0035D47E53